MNKYQINLILSNTLKFNFIKVRIGNQKSSAHDLRGRSGIPKVVFQTTKSKWLPWRFWIDVKKLREKNRDLVFITFDQKEMKRWMLTHYSGTTILNAFNDSPFGVVQSDIFKYCYAYKCGGISLDLSKYLSSSLNGTLVEVSHDLVLSQQSQPTQDKVLTSMFEEAKLRNNLLINWCFSTVPGNAAILRVIEIIENNYIRNKGKVFKEVADGIWNMTGPVAFNLGVLNHFLQEKEPKIGITGIDFGEREWPKFKNASLVNVYSHHYTEETCKVIFE